MGPTLSMRTARHNVNILSTQITLRRQLKKTRRAHRILREKDIEKWSKKPRLADRTVHKIKMNIEKLEQKRDVSAYRIGQWDGEFGTLRKKLSDSHVAHFFSFKRTSVNNVLLYIE